MQMLLLIRRLFTLQLLIALFVINTNAKQIYTCENAIVIDSNKLTLYVFLSTTCPMSQFYANELNAIVEKYDGRGLKVIGIFPNFFEKIKDVKQFKRKYNLQFEVMVDKGHNFTKKFSATITPEVFLTNKNGKVIYSGMIDNGFFKPSYRRGVTTAFYLLDAIEAYFNQTEIKTKRTKPVGCIIVLN